MSDLLSEPQFIAKAIGLGQRKRHDLPRGASKFKNRLIAKRGYAKSVTAEDSP